MTDQNVRPDLVHQIRVLQARVAELARRRLPAHGGPGVPIVIFTYPGNLTAGIESPRWYLEGGAITITQVRISLGTNATTDHDIELHRDGSNVGSFTLPSGDDTIVLPTAIEVRQGSFLTVMTVTVGVTDSDMSVILA